MLGKIKSIKEVYDIKISPVGNVDGRGGRLGITSMLNMLMGCSTMDGFRVETEEHTYYILIDNDTSCCESWGTISSEDDYEKFIGSELLEVNLTDLALNKQKVKESDYYDDEGGIQFVDFVTTEGVFQLAVYNSHNGYYGHGILVAKDDNIILNDVL